MCLICHLVESWGIGVLLFSTRSMQWSSYCIMFEKRTVKKEGHSPSESSQDSPALAARLWSPLLLQGFIPLFGTSGVSSVSEGEPCEGSESNWAVGV